MAPCFARRRSIRRWPTCASHSTRRKARSSAGKAPRPPDSLRARSLASSRTPSRTAWIGALHTLASMSSFLARGPRVSEEQKKRIPPGQYFTEKWPVLHYGSVPRVDLKTWDFKVWGEVENPFELTWAELKT